jgi:hypothetical protein
MAQTNVVQTAADVGRPRRDADERSRREGGRKSLAPPEGEAKKIGHGRGELPLEERGSFVKRSPSRRHR